MPARKILEHLFETSWPGTETFWQYPLGTTLLFRRYPLDIALPLWQYPSICSPVLPLWQYPSICSPALQLWQYRGSTEPIIAKEPETFIKTIALRS